MRIFKKIMWWLFIAFALVVVALLISAVIYINGLKKDLSLSQDTLSELNNETIIYDTNDELINTANIVNKKILSQDEIPDNLKNAFVSIEDKKFYNHQGINVKRMAKAMYNNIINHDIVEGASTISQQLIKNTHLTQEKTFDRKIKEILLTSMLEDKYDKDEILNMYLNIIYFGEGSYGVAGASKTFFNCSVDELTLGQCAGLAGIIKSPSKYSPIYNEENYINRRNLVLSEMKKDGRITPEQYESAINEGSNIDLNKDISKSKLYYKAVLNEAKQILGISEKDIAVGKYKIYSYLDESSQNELFDLINSDDYYIKNENGRVADGLATLVDNSTGGIIAYAGKSDYNLTSFYRQPGSAIKPAIVYSLALEKGIICPDSYILDEEINIDGYSPKNVGKTYHGYVTASECVAKSLNIAPVKLMKQLTLENCKSYAKNLGVTFSDSDQGYALALGGFTDGMTLNNLVNTYIPYTNNGEYFKTSFIKKIVSNNGNIVYENTPIRQKVMGEDTAYLMTDMLIDGVKNGTSKRLSSLPMEVAGKTGTVAIPNTNNNSDAISIAYTTKHTMGVWFGNYTCDSLGYLPSNNNGGTMATSVIKDTFKKLYKNKAPENFIVPDSVTNIDIDTISYDNDHEIKVVDSSMPDRYKKSILVSKRYSDYPISTTLSSLDINDLDIKINKNYVDISFTAKDYLTYDIYRLSDNGVDNLLKTISNKDEKVTFSDKNVDEDKYYTYFVKVNSNMSSSKSANISIKTPKKEKVYNNILDKIVKQDSTMTSEKNSSNWLFY